MDLVERKLMFPYPTLFLFVSLIFMFIAKENNKDKSNDK